jgi:hypothetical protein
MNRIRKAAPEKIYNVRTRKWGEKNIHALSFSFPTHFYFHLSYANP